MSMGEKKLSRRSLLKAGAALGVVPLAASCNHETGPINTDNLVRGPKTTWRMVTSWPPNFPILQTGAERFAELVTQMSGGALEIEVFAGGELVPPLGAFDAVAQGSVQASSSAAFYWASQVPAAQFFTAVPFGFNFDDQLAWLINGGGLELWEEIYEPSNLVPIPFLTTSYQMGGWFNRRIDQVSDLQGLKMRIPGLGGKVMAKAGVSVVLLPGAELFTSLQTGTIDATEWVGPYHDLILGFPEIAQYYYGPGWQEPGPIAELAIHKSDWDKLSDELKQIVRSAAADVTSWSLVEFETQNANSLAEVGTEYPNVEILRFPDDVLEALLGFTNEVLDEESEKNADFARVRESYESFSQEIAPWRALTENPYLK